MGKMFLLSSVPTLKDTRTLERKLIGHYKSKDSKQLQTDQAKAKTKNKEHKENKECTLLNASDGGEGLTREKNFIYYLTK